MKDNSDLKASVSGCAGSEPFALRVIGDSMAPEFADGVVIIRRSQGRL